MMWRLLRKQARTPVNAFAHPAGIGKLQCLHLCSTACGGAMPAFTCGLPRSWKPRNACTAWILWHFAIATLE